MKVQTRSQKATLNYVARSRVRPPRSRQCRICLEPEAFTETAESVISSLTDGICADRDACENRQPPLIPRAAL